MAEKNNVIYHGFVEDICEAYSSANILLFTSKYREGVPRAVLEAMAMKVPVVAYPIPGLKDVIKSKRNGFLAESFNWNALKVSLETALNTHDEVLKKIVDQARLDVELKYDSSIISEQYLTQLVNLDV